MSEMVLVFCFCIWGGCIYFSTSHGEVFFLYVPYEYLFIYIMLYKIFMSLDISKTKILDEGQMGPMPKILNSYFKSDFDSFFLFRFFIKFPVCIFQKM